MKKNGTEIASFTYDLMGRRTAETIDGVEKEYLWSGDSLLGEYSGDSLDRLYAVGNGVDEVLGIYDESGEIQYLHSNQVGSVTGVTDADGNIAGEREYTPFGMARDASGTVDTQLGFIGRKQYEEIGLTYIRARFYDPSSGRFITKDPVRDGFNWYSYCGANPVGFVDSSGTSSILEIKNVYDNIKNFLGFIDFEVKYQYTLHYNSILTHPNLSYETKKNILGDFIHPMTTIWKNIQQMILNII